MGFKKVNIGFDNKNVKARGQFDLGCRSSLTCNFGDVLPSYAMEIVPNSDVNINNISSLVRTTPLAVPSFGKLSLKHYVTFVKYSEVLPYFNEFLSQTDYNFEDSSEIPLYIPSFYIHRISEYFENEDLSKRL